MEGGDAAPEGASSGPQSSGTLGTGGYIPSGPVVILPSGRKMQCQRCRKVFDRKHVVPGTAKPTELGKKVGLVQEVAGLSHLCNSDTRKRGKK